jgi:uncharacterized protein (TIGR03435 family)
VRPTAQGIAKRPSPPHVKRHTTKIALLLAIASLAAAQTPPATPTFDVATVKPSDPDKPGGSLMMNNDTFQTQGQTLKAIIKFAYGLNMGADQQISGGPSWVDSAKFDINAKEDPDTVAGLKKLPRDQQTDQVRLMVRGLLAERFQLKLHHETKVLPVYSLVVAKGGVKMTPVVDDPPTADGAGPGPKTGKGHGIRMMGRGELNGMGANTAILTNVITMQPETGGRKVIDNTGLTGSYDFTLKWTPESGPAPEGGAIPDPAGPSFFTALQEQLGLKLDAIKAPVDTIVIDSAVMPSSN